MTRTTHLALPALALAGALVLGACGGGADTAASGTSSETSSGGHGSSHGGDSKDSGAEGSEADIAFLAGMVPHHEQAVEMSSIVLAAGPPAEVAAIARQIAGAQGPEIEQMNAMLADLGASAGAEGHGEHGGSHGGMMSDEELAELKAAKGTDAARLYLEAMIEHHEGAIEASDAQIADGEHAPAVALAREIKKAQQAEIAEMQGLLEQLKA